ncbi:urease accessory protein UreD [Cantharellus anzutake]|uniref:urease accessory protein UreD n=1 Tax=Cantharellus anzutake TaxID=1750568 RepID=UPI00190712F5|nr:urease accessory protein UreD [Cantharellus anzutake]KAF8327897.1 urease accessory protein UreD [Cantharellus anzutake]
MDARVSSDAILLLLPDPVTPFSSASYSQTQTFHLEDPASSAAVILDWFTSGRMARGEEWDFERYRSTNEVWIQGRRVLRDVMLLESPQDSGSTANSFSQPRSVRERLAPYACYATLFIIIPSDPTTTGTTNPTDSSAISFPVRTYKALAEIVSRLSETYDAIRQMQASSPEDLVWSLSPLNMRAPSLYTDLDRSELRGGFSSGVIIRVAGLTTELVRNWLRGSLRPLDGLIGRDAYKNAFV